MNTSRHVIIRADASPSIGGGHIVRCLALAEALSRDGWRVTFAVGPETLATVPLVARSGYPWIVLTHSDDPAELVAMIPEGCDLLVVDHYGLDRRYEAACRPWTKQIVAIDDFPARSHDCDLLVDQTFGRSPDDYAAYVPSGCRVLGGSNYAMLRPSFFAARTGPRQRTSGGNRVLLMMGAVDACEMLLPVFETIVDLSAEFDIVVGASAKQLSNIRKAAERTGARLHIDAQNMPELMMETDLAVLAAGTSVWEAACVGLPMVVIATVDNQIEVARVLEQAGAALVVQDETEIREAVSRLLANPSARVELSKSASRLCDARGPNRIAIQLRPEAATDGEAVSLRAAHFDDSELILAWQMYPATRRFARNKAVPERREHEIWLSRKLDDAGCLLSIILYNDEPAGLLRLDRTDAGNSTFEVSILTAPNFYRRGIAAAALRLARRLVPDVRLSAEVLPENTASYRLFEAAGFEPGVPGWFYQEPALRADGARL